MQYCPDIMISNLSSDIGPCNSGGIWGQRSWSITYHLQGWPYLHRWPQTGDPNSKSHHSLLIQLETFENSKCFCWVYWFPLRRENEVHQNCYRDRKGRQVFRWTWGVQETALFTLGHRGGRFWCIHSWAINILLFSSLRRRSKFNGQTDGQK